MALTRDQILSANTAPVITEVDVPEWGGKVAIRVLSGRQRERFENAINNHSNLRALLVSLSVCDEKGSPIFSEADVNVLGEKSGKALKRVFDASIKHSAIGKESVEELEKNSEAPTFGATPSVSRDDAADSTSTSS